MSDKSNTHPLHGKRKRKKTSNANPLFSQWLAEWRDQAREKGWKSEFIYSKALKSLQKFPLALNSGKECKVLQHFGDKICKMLDDRLLQYRQQQQTENQSSSPLQDLNCDAHFPRSVSASSSGSASRSRPANSIHEVSDSSDDDGSNKVHHYSLPSKPKKSKIQRTSSGSGSLSSLKTVGQTKNMHAFSSRIQNNIHHSSVDDVDGDEISVVEDASSLKRNSWDFYHDDDNDLPTLTRLPDLPKLSRSASAGGNKKCENSSAVPSIGGERSSNFPTLPRLADLGARVSGSADLTADVRATATVRMTHDVSDSDGDEAGQAVPQQPQRGRGGGHQAREYVPAYRSGPYAILLTLYRAAQDPNFKGYMTKAELSRIAQPLCDKSFTVPDFGSRYTAWSSTSTLTKKGFLVKESSPAKYRLTDAGYELAQRLEEVERRRQAGDAGDGGDPAVWGGGGESGGCGSGVGNSAAQNLAASRADRLQHANLPPPIRENVRKAGTAGLGMNRGLQRNDPCRKASDGARSTSGNFRPISSETAGKCIDDDVNVNMVNSVDSNILDDDEDISIVSEDFSAVGSININRTCSVNFNLENTRKDVAQMDDHVTKEEDAWGGWDFDLPDVQLPSLSHRLKSNSSTVSGVVDAPSLSGSARRLRYWYVADGAQLVKRKDDACVSVDEEIGVGFLVKIDYQHLLQSGSRYKLDMTRPLGDFAFVYLSDLDCYEEAQPPEMSKPAESSEAWNVADPDGPATSSYKLDTRTSAVTSVKPAVKSVKPVHCISDSDSDSEPQVMSLASRIGMASSSSALSSHLPPTSSNSELSHNGKYSSEASKAIGQLHTAKLSSGVSNSKAKPCSRIAPKSVSVARTSALTTNNVHDLASASASGSQGSSCSMPRVESSSGFHSQNSVDSSASTASSSVASVEDFILFPGTFEIVLCVDNREFYGSNSSSKSLLPDLIKNGVTCELRLLSVGDLLWIAREKAPPGFMPAILGSAQPPPRKELVLNYIVERKRMDDLVSSMISGRLREQKFRLKRSGLQDKIILIESYGSMQHFSISEDRIKQAIANTEIIDGFMVKQTKDSKETAAYLTLMTRYLQSYYQNKTLRSCSQEAIKEMGIRFDVKDTEQFLMPFEHFNQVSLKTKPLTVLELFGKQLIQVWGVSAEKAKAIVDRYPTPTSLLCAYAACTTEKEKESLLANVKFGKNQRNLGIAVSRQICKLYTSMTLT